LLRRCLLGRGLLGRLLLLEITDACVLICLILFLVRPSPGRPLSRYVRAAAYSSRAQQRTPPHKHRCLLVIA